MWRKPGEGGAEGERVDGAREGKEKQREQRRHPGLKEQTCRCEAPRRCQVYSGGVCKIMTESVRKLNGAVWQF